MRLLLFFFFLLGCSGGKLNRSFTFDQSSSALGFPLQVFSQALFAHSEDGEIQVRATAGSFILLSRDGGKTWVPLENLGATQWTFLQLSPDGKVLTAWVGETRFFEGEVL